MLNKSKVIAAGLSLFLASAASVANAGESSAYSPHFPNDNGCRAVYLDGTLGFEGNFEMVEYSVPSMSNGESVSVPGIMLSNGVASSTGDFSCVNGTVYYSGEDYISYDWSW